MKQFSIHCYLFIALMIGLCACDYNNFPAGPQEDIHTFDTITIPGLDVPVISVRTAVAIGKELENKATTGSEYYICGIVCSFDSKYHEDGMKSFGNAVFYIRDSQSSSVEFEAFRIYGIDNNPFTDMNQIAIGDTVVVCGKITKFNSVIETPQTKDYNAHLYWSSNMLAYGSKDVRYLEENFANDLNGWTSRVVSDPGMSDVWKQNTTTRGQTSARAQAVDAEGTKHAGEVWLVSPAIDLVGAGAGSAKLTFQTYYQKGNADIKNLLRVKVSADDGKNWTDMEIPNLSNGVAPNHVADTLDISAYKSAQTRVAFAYKSTADVAPLWDIKEVTIMENKRSR